MKKNKLSIVFLVIVFSFTCYSYTYGLPKWFPFNNDNALNEWQEKIFKNRVLYIVKTEEKGGYLSAKSEQACSSLLYRIKFHPKKFPMISWQWKVSKFPEKGTNKVAKGGWLEKDDYAARVYVIFPSWIFFKIKCIEYIWDETLPEGTIITSPYSRNIKLIVAESGIKNKNKWVKEERNIYQDYLKAFGRRPGWVGAIALMTDTDNTLSTAEAQYTNIKVRYKNEQTKE
ncbi:MAG: DUF3047 domain-containing protein [Omnitrophica bacterium]|nr:DUF3047 domain-containing protein [Candidatus Omnitrophota bacterium]